MAHVQQTSSKMAPSQGRWTGEKGQVVYGYRVYDNNNIF